VIHRFKAKFPYLKGLEFIQYWPGLIDTTRDLFPTVLRDERAPWVHFVLGCRAVCPGAPLLRLAGYDVSAGRGIYRLQPQMLGQLDDFASRWQMELSLRYVF
jgi:hypothetical protein